MEILFSLFQAVKHRKRKSRHNQGQIGELKVECSCLQQFRAVPTSRSFFPCFFSLIYFDLKFTSALKGWSHLRQSSELSRNF